MADAQGYVAALEQANGRLQRIETALEEALAATELGEVLWTMPGIGPVTTAMYLGVIGDLDAGLGPDDRDAAGLRTPGRRSL